MLWLKSFSLFQHQIPLGLFTFSVQLKLRISQSQIFGKIIRLLNDAFIQIPNGDCVVDSGELLWRSWVWIPLIALTTDATASSSCTGCEFCTNVNWIAIDSFSQVKVIGRAIKQAKPFSRQALIRCDVIRCDVTTAQVDCIVCCPVRQYLGVFYHSSILHYVHP